MSSKFELQILKNSSDKIFHSLISEIMKTLKTDNQTNQDFDYENYVIKNIAENGWLTSDFLSIMKQVTFTNTVENIMKNGSIQQKCELETEITTFSSRLLYMLDEFVRLGKCPMDSEFDVRFTVKKKVPVTILSQVGDAKQVAKKSITGRKIKLRGHKLKKIDDQDETEENVLNNCLKLNDSEDFGKAYEITHTNRVSLGKSHISN